LKEGTDFLATARLHSPHGLKGEMKASSISGDDRHLYKLTEARLTVGTKSSSVKIEAVKKSGQNVLIKIAGIDSPEAAKAWSNAILSVPRELASSLSQGEYYCADLVGCRVYHGDQSIGEITAVFEAAGNDLLEICLADTSVRNVPFRKEFIGDVDIAGRKVELKELWILE
jgi:16S rRNA processing protein RimM